MTRPRLANPPVPAIAETEISEDNTPEMALYRLYAADGELLYVGVTGVLKDRFRDHRRLKPWWHLVARRTVTFYGSKPDTYRAESIAIATERPRYNVAGILPPDADSLETPEEAVAADVEEAARWERFRQRQENNRLRTGRRDGLTPEEAAFV